MIVVAERLDPEALALLHGEHEVHADADLHARPAELRAALADAAALIVRNATRVDAELLDAAPRLRVVGRVGVGLDNLDLAALRARGVPATWTPGSNAVSVAEYTLGALLELFRRYRAATAAVRAGGWPRVEFGGLELSGRTLGIVGLGDIGSRVARLARAFGMRVVASDPAVERVGPVARELGVELLPLPELLTRCDALTLHAPLTESTRGLIGEEALARLRDDALFVNTARGGLVDEAALARALAAGRLAGVALDVRDPEPPGPDDPLARFERVILTPHVAGVTREALRRGSLRAAEDVLRVLRGEAPRWPVPTG